LTLTTVPATVNQPLRLHEVVFGSTVNVTVPFPDPDAPLVTVIHALLVVAVHGQPAAAVTVLLPLPPDAVNDWLTGDTVGEHEFPACVTVNVAPAIVSVPVRLPPVFGATSNVMEPSPVPDAPLATVIHALLLTAVHGQSIGAVTVPLPIPPGAGNDWLVGDTVAEHELPPCVTVNVAPAMVMVPVRVDPVLFATANVTAPFPVLEAPLVTVIQLSLLTAVHVHQSAAVTVVVPVPPVDAND
jgi:hypothetical protein